MNHPVQNSDQPAADKDQLDLMPAGTYVCNPKPVIQQEYI